MPEINPLSNDQIFLKKIAENTGSDYNTGDVSEINPLTIDQILLKEIAANTAGQSGDITELEEKVTANAEAIEAMVNVTGSCNILPCDATTQTIEGITWTVNADGTVTASGTASANGSVLTYYRFTSECVLNGKEVILKGCPVGGGASSYSIAGFRVAGSSSYLDNREEYGEGVRFTWNNDSSQVVPEIQLAISPNYAIQGTITFKPMLYDARLEPTGYVPYAMTNRELTDNVVKLSNVTPQQISEPTISLQLGGVLKYGRLAIVQLRLATTSNTPTSGVLYAGLPKPYLFNNLTYDAVFLTSNNGKASIDAQGTLYYGDITAGNSIIVTGTYIWSETGY